MSLFNMFFITPLELLYEVIFMKMYDMTLNYGVSIVFLSLIVNLLALPLYRKADEMQKKERDDRQRISKWEDHIKKHFKGDERYMILQTYYRQNGYNPVYALRSAIPLLLQIPFFIAAYRYLSGLEELRGVSFIGIRDLGCPDALITAGALSINLLPVIMTVINLLSAHVYLKDRALKDRVQSYVIAVVFLVLLYRSPAGLVLYWICNQVFSLVKNMLDRLLKNTGFNNIQVRRIIEKNLGFEIKELFPIFFFVFTLYIFAPAEIYLKNAAEFWFIYSDMWSVFAELSLFTSLIFLVVFYKLPSRIKVLQGILYGLTFMLYIQGNILLYDYGELDGTAIDWHKFTSRGIYNSLIWLLFIVMMPVIVCKKNQTIYFIRRIAYVVMFVQICTLAVGMSNIGSQEKRNVNGYISTENEFNISSHKNTLILVLDAFDSELMQDLIREYPEEVEQALQDFTYYHDTLGASGNTLNSVPVYLTGMVNDKSLPFSEYMWDAYEKSPLIRELAEHDYNTGFYLSSHLVASSIKNASQNYKVQRIKVDGQLGLGLKFMQLTAFKYAPHVLKPFFWVYTGQFNRMKLLDGVDLYSPSNFVFNEKLKEEGFVADSDKDCFRYYHIDGSHVPYNMNENCELLSDNSGSEMAQARGCLKIVKRFCDSLKNCGVYDDTVIIVMADHGWTRQMHQNPLFMIKQRGDMCPFTQSEISLSYMDLPDLLCDFLKNDKIDITTYEKNEGRFYYDAEEIKGTTTLTEYLTYGKAYDSSLMKPTGRIFYWRYR